MRLSFFVALLALAACGPSSDPSSGDGVDPTDTLPAGDDDDDDLVVGDDDDDDDAPITTSPQDPGLWGTLIGADGQSIPHADVQACSALTCLTGRTADDGSFAFVVAPGTHIAFKTHETISEDPPRAAAIAPCIIADGPAIDLGDVYVPDLPNLVLLGATDPQELALDDGLVLTLDADALQAPFGVFLAEVGGTRIPDEYVPTYEALAAEEVLDAFALYPFSTQSTAAIGIALPTDLPAGTSVNIRTINHLDGTFSDPVVGVSDGTSIRTAPGEGVFALTHLVVSKP